MSSSLVRQALAFVDQEDSRKRNKRRAGSTGTTGIVQGFSHPYRRISEKVGKKLNKPKEISAEEKIKKLLALSSPVSDGIRTDKIIERAVKGKPLLEKVEVAKEEEKSILFPEETFEDFEKEYFCS